MTRTLMWATLVVCVACGGKGTSPEPAPSPEIVVPVSQDDGGPRIEFGELVVEGPRDGGDVIQAANAGLAGLRKCYADRLAKDPELGEGEVSLRLFVATSGSVEDALLHNNKLTDHRVGTCMIGVAKTWKLPPVQQNEPTRVILPMTLTPPP
jgi:hypothetical protein